MQITPDEILQLIPAKEPFRFVDELKYVDAEKAIGNFHFRADLDFYKGHFPDMPVTPGVILTECMGQIAAIPIGIFLLRDQPELVPVLSRTEVDFLEPVFPGDRVEVEGIKILFRKGILRCETVMKIGEREVCHGILTCKFVDRREWK